MITIPKEITTEYLKAFHRAVLAHPDIYDQLKQEIHKKARGSAGGQIKAAKADIELEDIAEHLEGPTKVINAAQAGKILAEDDETITVEIFPMKEGVYTAVGTPPTLKKYDEFAPYVHWLDGVPITKGHVYPNEFEVTNLTPKPGKILNTGLDPDNRRARSEGKYFKSSITPDRLEKLRNGVAQEGSIEYMCSFKDESGEFEGKHYDRVEVGPYYFYNYAEVPRGACSVSDGCGIQANSAAVVEESDDVLRLVDGRIRKYPKILNEAIKMAEEVEALKAEFTKQLNAAIEMITPLSETISELTKKIDTLAGEHKQLNEKFTGKVAAEDAAREGANKAVFKKSLNAAAATEIDTLWDEVKSLNPVEYETWKQTNTAKLLTEAEAKQATGRKQANAGGDQVASARAKADETLFKRR